MELQLSLEYYADQDFESNVKRLDALVTKQPFAYHLDVMRRGCTAKDRMTDRQYDFVIENVTRPIDAHVMLPNPAANIGRYIDPRLRSLVFQMEAAHSDGEIMKILDHIKRLGVKAGVCIDAPTAINKQVAAIIRNCDVVTLLGIKMAESGTPLRPETLAKIQQVRKINPNIRVIWDGGVRLENLDLFKGADNCVIATAVFKVADQKAAIEQLQAKINQISTSNPPRNP